jgi:hypothetical protein
VGLTQDISLKRYTQRITDLLQRPWAIDSDGALHPKALPLRSLARQTWINLHDTIEAQLGEFDELANVRPSASKAADNLLRIAGVLAVLEDRDLIEVTHILSAKRSAARRIHTRGRSESGKSKITLQESTMRTL